MNRITFLTLLTILFLVIGCSAKEPLPATIYLTDYDWQDITMNEEEEPTKDQSQNEDTLTLRNNDRQPVEFEKGISLSADTEITYDLTKFDHDYLTTWVGVDHKAADRKTYVQFEIYLDGERKYESKQMGYTTPMEYVQLEISGAETLTIAVKEGVLESDLQYGVWADMQLHMANPIVRTDNEIKEYDDMVLVFNEEFAGEEIDQEQWTLRTQPENGTHHYANIVGEGENIWVKDGNLHIQAKKYYEHDNYSTTSAAMSTENKFYFRYGRVDVRAKLPTESGMWPAIWLMPEKAAYGWPMAGEIDVMELISQESNKIWSTIHTGIYEQDEYYKTYGDTLTIDQGTFFDDYHVFSMEWEPDRLAFFVDDELVTEVEDWESYVIDQGEVVEKDYPFPYNRYFYLILNLATGGWSQDVNESTRYGERTTMLVDYVRVYEKDYSPADVAELIDLVDYFDMASDFTEEGIEALTDHLVRIKELEDDNKEELISQLTTFKALLDEQNETGNILFSDAYEGLMQGTDEFIATLEQ